VIEDFQVPGAVPWGPGDVPLPASVTGRVKLWCERFGVDFEVGVCVLSPGIVDLRVPIKSHFALVRL
jgi:hypothetical protein